jgi:hypothetical protein
MLEIGIEEIEKLPQVGKKFKCQRCNVEHDVYNGKDREGNDDDTLQFYRCKGSAYLCGINGRKVIERPNK